MGRLAAAALVAALVAAASLPAAGSSRVEVKSYLATDTGPLCAFGGPDGLGGACFSLLGTDRTVSISVSDATALPVGGVYRFLDIGLRPIRSGSFCGSASGVRVPSGAVMVEVGVEVALGALDGCADKALLGAGTTGDIQLVASS